MPSFADSGSLRDLVPSEVASRVLERALQWGASFAELYVEDRETHTIAGEGGRLCRSSSGWERGAAIRVVSEGVCSLASTDSLDLESLLDAAGDAGRAARGSSPVPRIMRRLSASLPLVPEDGEVAIAALVDLASSGEHAALRVDRSLRRAAVFVGRSRQRVMIANSEGNFAEDVRDRLRCRVQATAEDRAGTRVGVGTRAAGVCGPPLELDPVDVGRRAGRQALLQLQAGPSPFGPMPVVLASGAAATLLHETFGHALMLASSGGRSVLSGRLDERIGSPALRIVDDGRISGGWGSGRHDDEGHPTGVTALLEEGRLRSFLYDRQSGSELGAAGSTGNARRTSFKSLPRPRTTNMYVSPGTATRQDVIEATPSGLYVEALAGGRADPVTGDFCFSVREACLIRDGHLCHPVRGASLGGNLIQLLEAVDLVGDDLELAAGNCPLYNEPLCMGIGQPTLRIARLMVGGQLQGKNVNEDIAAAAGLA